MKILLVLFVISATSFMGFTAGRQYKNKVIFFRDLLLFCVYVKNEVSFFKSKLSDILNKGKLNCNENFNDLCKIANQSLQQGRFVLLEEKNLHFLKFLSFSERQTITNFFNFLGKSDENNQKNQIDSYEKIFSDYSERAKQDYDSKAGLYGKLGVYAGLFLAILCL